MPETQTPPEPLARYGKLVRATTGAPTGAYELTVGDLCIRTDEWNKAAAEKWLPVIVAAVNAYSENVQAQIPRTQDVANTTDSPERLSAAPCSSLVRDSE